MKKLSACLGFVLFALLFQNCDHVLFSSNAIVPAMGTGSFLSGTGNGVGYDGKIFVSDEKCQGTEITSAVTSSVPSAKLILRTGGAQLVREFCQDLVPPKAVGPEEFFVDPLNQDILVYQNKTFIGEVPLNNQIQFLQKTEINSFGTVSQKTFVPAFPTKPTQGNLLVCMISYTSQTYSISRIQDAEGNSLQRAGVPNVGFSLWQLEMWYREGMPLVASSGPLEITMTGDITGQFMGSCFEYSGVASSNAFITTVSNTDLIDASGIGVLPAIAHAGGPELVVGYMISNVVVSGFGYSERARVSNDSYFDKVVVAAGSSSPKAFVSGIPFWSGVAASFRGR